MDRSVAYFSMEIGINQEIKTYSGGLGVLAGDTLKSAADLGLNFSAVTLMYREGYFKQVLENGMQTEEPQEWDYFNLLEDTGVKTTVNIRGEEIDVKAWKYTIDGEDGGVDVYFLDTGLDSNSDYGKALTSSLYDGDDEFRLSQEALLGIGGAKMVEELGLNPGFFHMNEGHSALLTLEASGKKIFTTHTPVPAGHDSFDKETVESVLGEKSENLDLENGLNMTKLALKHSDYNNTVSEKHKEVSEEMFPQHSFNAVTNGVHSKTWTSQPYQSLFDKHLPLWRKDSQRLHKALTIPDRELWESNIRAKKSLNNILHEDIDVNTFTIGFARRSTAYKRPTLIFKDLEELERLGKKYQGLNLVYGAKAHPKDTHGKELIQQILQYSELLENVDVQFVENYSMDDALKMVSGCDLWLNNPVRGKEASGTSGMKAAHNGTPQLSTLDGWWLEGHIEDATGWSIGENYVTGEDEDRVDSKSIYRKLDRILSIYHNDREEWINVMKHCIALNASYFNTERMIKEYVTKAYR